MAQAKVTTIISTPVTIENWGELEQKVFYNGVEVRKANQSSAVPKVGTQPLFYYTSKKGTKGDWYSVEDLTVLEQLSKEDKALVRELNKKRDALYKEYRAHAISKEVFDARDAELAETIDKIQN